MTVELTCPDPAKLAGYLYDECEPAERAAVEAHLAVCLRCAADVAALGATRMALASWTPPDAALGFRVVSDAAGREAEAGRVLRPARWWQRPMPAWAQAAAAILIFAGGVGLGMRRADVPAAAPAQSSPAVSAVSAQDLTALERRLRAEMSVLRASEANATAPAQVPSNDAALLQRVRTLLTESEERQQQELAFRLTQAMRDIDSQRRMDLSRIEQTFGQMEGFTRPELADQRNMINYLIQRTGMRAPQ